MYALSCTPATTAKVLIVPVWFTNSNNFIAVENKDVVREDIRKAYLGTNEETGWRSVKTFYEEESHGKLTLEGTVSEWYENNASYSVYGSEMMGQTKTVSLLKKVTKWYFENHPEEDRKDYDCDGDGYLDGVIVIYGSPEYSSLGYNSSYKNLWAYTSWTQSTADVNNPNLNAFFWASYDFMYGSNTAAEHTGLSSSAKYYCGDTRYCNIDSHTFIHEMGHMFGLDDYYDYEGKYCQAGGFSMQDQAVGGHDAYSIFALGWGQAYIPTESMTINLKPLTTSGEMIILSPSWNSYNSPFDEYLILEFYTPTGLNDFDSDHPSGGNPSGTRSSGIRLWHVDARLAVWTGYDASGNATFDFANTTNPLTPSNGITTMMDNSYRGDYKDFHLLQFIRNSKSTSYNASSKLRSEYLFRAGQSFDMETYKSQFVNSGKLNNNKTLGYSFTVDAIQSDYATVTITKD